jgi:hypothetical protein
MDRLGQEPVAERADFLFLVEVGADPTDLGRPRTGRGRSRSTSSRVVHLEERWWMDSPPVTRNGPAWPRATASSASSTNQ